MSTIGKVANSRSATARPLALAWLAAGYRLPAYSDRSSAAAFAPTCLGLLALTNALTNRPPQPASSAKLPSDARFSQHSLSPKSCASQTQVTSTPTSTKPLQIGADCTY